MRVDSLDHVNIVTHDLDRAEAFYGDVVGLRSGDVPPPLTYATARWMYDAGGRAVVHLNGLAAPRVFDRDMIAGPTGALHHVALRCTGHEAMATRLAALGIAYHGNAIAAIGLRQIFVRDPDGVVLELNFFGE